jgi:hypothetical protein
MRYLLSLLFTLFLVSGCGIESTFKQTQAGKAIYSCVAGSGQLDVKSMGDDKVEAHLIKADKDVRMQFAVNSSIGQAKLIGAKVAGEEKLSKFTLMLNLELMCGGELSSQMLPDEYNALRMMNTFSR